MIRQVRAALEREPRIRRRRHAIDVRVSGGSAILHGEVDDIAAKRLATERARTIDGIRNVVDGLRIAARDRPGDGVIRDAVCSYLIDANRQLNCTIRVYESEHLETLQRVAEDGGGEIRVRVEDAVVILEGEVISLSHKRIAGVLAWWAPGVADVVNDLDIFPAQRDNDEEIVEALRFVMEMDAQLDAAQVTARCEARCVTLDGYVRSEHERQRAELDAWALGGVRDVINRIELQS
jgi:osmotically-inducible protein OsmY